ncbi:MAG: hypothetical protein ACYTE0_07835 [Planctomycetota bacterium]
MSRLQDTAVGCRINRATQGMNIEGLFSPKGVTHPAAKIVSRAGV